MEHEQPDQKKDEYDEIDEKSALMMSALIGIGTGKIEPHGFLCDDVPRSVLEIPA
jgi:hypothetical protein